MKPKSPVFKTAAGEARYLEAYETTLELWPVPFEERDVATEFGSTHVIVSGPEEGQPLLLLIYGDEELRELDAPTLLLIGGDEVVFDPEKAVARARRLIADLRAELIPGASHCLPMEQPAQVNARILAFLNEARSQRRTE